MKEKIKSTNKHIQILKTISIFLSGTGTGMLIKDIANLPEELTLTESLIDIILIFFGLSTDEYCKQKLEKISDQENSQKVLERKK